jgi:hypothetical protein
VEKANREMSESYVGKRVQCVAPLAVESLKDCGVPPGAKGLCTADGKDDNVFVVLFDERLIADDPGYRWITFQSSAKSSFQIVGT